MSEFSSSTSRPSCESCTPPGDSPPSSLSSAFAEIYTPHGFDNSYPDILAAIYNVNGLLRKEGIMAPSEDSLNNTRRLYDLVGSPLNRIPTIHVGGTNGKASN